MIASAAYVRHISDGHESLSRLLTCVLWLLSCLVCAAGRDPAMCICFWYCSLGREEEQSAAGVPKSLQTSLIDSRYVLVLASNRDEVFSRPTQPSHAWEERGRPDIIAGRSHGISHHLVDSEFQ